MFTGGNVKISTRDGLMPAYRVAPDGVPSGGVVVVQEAFGVTSHIEDVANRFAAAGYLALAPALFHRAGSPVLAYDDLDAAREVMSTLTAEGLHMDVRAALEALAAQGLTAKRIAVVGFCMGGSVTLVAATTHLFGAAVSFYGGGVAQGRFGFPPLLELASALRTPWLGLYGDADKGIPVEQVVALRAASSCSAVATEVVRYPDAEHGFHCDDRPAVFHPVAAADAWRRTLAWLDTHLSG
jgi:carboxymethylenebutenolidase